MGEIREFIEKNGGNPSPVPSLPTQALPKLVIELWRDGSVQVTGPIEDKVLSYGMLEAAKDAIHDYRPSPIIPV